MFLLHLEALLPPVIPVLAHQQKLACQPWHRHPTPPQGIALLSAGISSGGTPWEPVSHSLPLPPQKEDVAPLPGVPLPRAVWAFLPP